MHNATRECCPVCSLGGCGRCKPGSAPFCKWGSTVLEPLLPLLLGGKKCGLPSAEAHPRLRKHILSLCSWHILQSWWPQSVTWPSPRSMVQDMYSTSNERNCTMAWPRAWMQETVKTWEQRYISYWVWRGRRLWPQMPGFPGDLPGRGRAPPHRLHSLCQFPKLRTACCSCRSGLWLQPALPFIESVSASLFTQTVK